MSSPAFPNLKAHDAGPRDARNAGMSKREWYAGQALAGFCAATDADGTWQSDPFYAAQKAFEHADAMIAAGETGAENPEVARLRKELQDAQDQIAEFELLRPIWAKGFTSDGVAAQTTSSALTSIWKKLGVKDQTMAMQRLDELFGDGLEP